MTYRPLLTFEPTFGRIHVIASVIGPLAGVLVNWLTTVRCTATVAHPEPVASWHAAWPAAHALLPPLSSIRL